MAQVPGNAGGEAPGPAGLLVSFVPFILIFVLFYFLLIMPQQKRAKAKKAMVDGLKKGDRVLTNGGLLGTITNLSPQVITLQVAEGTRIKVMRSYIEEVRADDPEGMEAK